MGVMGALATAAEIASAIKGGYKQAKGIYKTVKGVYKGAKKGYEKAQKPSKNIKKKPVKKHKAIFTPPMEGNKRGKIPPKEMKLKYRNRGPAKLSKPPMKKIHR